jgi:hypothetical protein
VRGDRGGLRTAAHAAISESGGGVHALVALLLADSGSTPLARRHAARALHALACAGGAVASTMLTAGCVPPLVAALTTSREAQGFAVGALCALAKSGGLGARAAIAHAGGVPPLYSLAYSPCASVRTLAADALNLLGYIGPESIGGGGYGGAVSDAEPIYLEEGGFPMPWEASLGATPAGTATARRVRQAGRSAIPIDDDVPASPQAAAAPTATSAPPPAAAPTGTAPSAPTSAKPTGSPAAPASAKPTGSPAAPASAKPSSKPLSLGAPAEIPPLPKASPRTPTKGTPKGTPKGTGRGTGRGAKPKEGKAAKVKGGGSPVTKVVEESPRWNSSTKA